ncbi:dephospho-CoA kinase [Paenibacillus sp. WQ 127069]|uniref:Dephospho-CoA kinase n=1 Tax=Paenibacillus baimaensis TaxID=2982185 RepID=A0ABT2UIY8_9BACL|nr:dephospho-CoA kinase [Paenibacillus sp. WQ 127069]MCU6794612.1 dephospho-CoA kinase [Paenibacillus sp. WQ 127069]
MNIGLTGGIACGKSTVSNMLVQRGAMLVDADRIAREVVEPGMPALDTIVDRFGKEILFPDGTLNRKKLGETVFGNTEALKDLQNLLHPSIRALMRERMEQYENLYPDKLVVADIPLLYESGLEAEYDAIMVVYVPRAVQLERLMLRDGMTLQAAEQRLQAQMDIELKKAKADIVIDNQGDLILTEGQVDRFLRERGLL